MHLVKERKIRVVFVTRQIFHVEYRHGLRILRGSTLVIAGPTRGHLAIFPTLGGGAAYDMQERKKAEHHSDPKRTVTRHLINIAANVYNNNNNNINNQIKNEINAANQQVNKLEHVHEKSFVAAKLQV